MDFANERYVRVYTRNTTTWKRLGWQGQLVLMQVLRLADRAGVVDIDDMDPADAISLHTDVPLTITREGIARCLELGSVKHVEGQLLLPRYMEAQECAQSDKQRQRESRERRRDLAKSEDSVTFRDEKSQSVTDGHSVPSRAVPSLTVPCSQNARAQNSQFEKPPLGEAPTNTAPSEPAPIRPESRCWQLYQRALGTEHLMLSPNHYDALQALASAAKAEADGETHGEAFDRAAERILGAWMAEKYWQEKRPGLRNLKERLEEGKYAASKRKPLLKAVEKHYSDAELLALQEYEEFTLSYFDKHRRWELLAAKERREDAARAAGGAP
jgi:hypothetical protein